MNAKRRAQDNDQSPAQIRIQRCCNCAKEMSISRTLFSCTECGHITCIRCSVLVYSHLSLQDIIRDEHEDAIPPSLSPHPGLTRQQYGDTDKYDREKNLEMGISGVRRDQEHEIDHNTEDRQAQEPQLQTQQPPTERQQQVVTGVPSKRNLNMSKCERCRLDKKKVCCLYILITTCTAAAWRTMTTSDYYCVSHRCLQTNANNRAIVSSRGSSLAGKV